MFGELCLECGRHCKNKHPHIKNMHEMADSEDRAATTTIATTTWLKHDDFPPLPTIDPTRNRHNTQTTTHPITKATTRHVTFDMCPDFKNADQERHIEADWVGGPDRNIDFGMDKFTTDKHQHGSMRNARALGDSRLARIIGIQEGSKRHSELQKYLKLDDVEDKDWDLAYNELCAIEDDDIGEIVEINDELDESPNEASETPITSISTNELEDLLQLVEGLNVLESERTDNDILALLPRATLMTIALDSGACDHVANEEDLRGFKVHATEASKAGRGYIAANGERIPNQGECRVGLKDPGTGVAFDSLFNLAPVSRPLFSVGRICDNGAEVHFTATRATVSKAGRKLAVFERKDGLYVATVEVRGEANPASTFVGQGARS